MPFCGSAKPDSLDEFFGDLIVKINNLQSGFEFCGKKLFLKISSVMCDAPARAFVKGIKSHTGYYGCDKCIQSGVYLSNRMTFPENNSSRRTDENFKSMYDEDNHLLKSPLQDTQIGMVSQFPHEYMHIVCLGVMHHLLDFWINGPLQCRLPASSVRTLSERLVGLKTHIPSEYARKPRTVLEKKLSSCGSTRYFEFSSQQELHAVFCWNFYFGKPKFMYPIL